ncbi:dCTP deaminase [Pseudomonas oryzihabitans]|uniref:dCTP deaminase n=1 Tax=Pseudomonas oryzihabitans TaxID=47885 RepID=UPI00111D8A27|nr:hypothetical protein [Pseudomonas psychrotolerans]QDD90196.1 hypothetical protein CCZ28_14690 [Pseudomonas psychrotolerans]
MILNDTEITNRSNGPNALISPFSSENLRLSSYDLTVGKEYYIGQSDTGSLFETQTLRTSQSITIPPHAVCFILTEEQINLSDDITARVSLRMTHIYAGMVLTSQPPFDPNYRGKVVVMLHNLSSAPYHLKCGERVATIEFTKLISPAQGNRVHRSVHNLEAQLSKPLVSSLTEIANASTSVQNKINWLSGQMLIFAALVVAVLAVPGFFSYSTLLDRLSEQRDQIKEISKDIDDFKKKLESSESNNNTLIEKLSILEKKTRNGTTLISQPSSSGGDKQ